MAEERALTTTEDPYMAMEKADEHQVLAEMQGRFIGELVYSFRSGGQEVTGLSLAGVRETVRTMNSRGLSRIRVSEREPRIVETDEYFEVLVYAEDTANGGGAWGVKRQLKRHQNGSVNVFALEMALSKAQRNAQRALIPEYFVKSMIEEFGKLTGSIKRVIPSPRVQPAKPSGAKPEMEIIAQHGIISGRAIQTPEDGLATRPMPQEPDDGRIVVEHGVTKGFASAQADDMTDLSGPEFEGPAADDPALRNKEIEEILALKKRAQIEPAAWDKAMLKRFKQTDPWKLTPAQRASLKGLLLDSIAAKGIK